MQQYLELTPDDKEILERTAMLHLELLLMALTAGFVGAMFGPILDLPGWAKAWIAAEAERLLRRVADVAALAPTRRQLDRALGGAPLLGEATTEAP